jgi:hypothetical protein
LDGRGGLRLELVDVGLNAVLAQRRLNLRRARLQVVGVLRKRGSQVSRLAHERACKQDEAADAQNANQQVRHHDGDQPIAQARGQPIDGSAQRKREYGRQREQDQGVQNGADNLPYHPQNRDAREHREQHDQRLLPIAVQQATSRKRVGRPSQGRRFSMRGVECLIEWRCVSWGPVCPGPRALIVLCCQARITFQGGWWPRR